MTWKKSDVILFFFALVSILSCFAYIAYKNHAINSINPQIYKDAVGCLCEQIDMTEIYQRRESHPAGLVFPIHVPKTCANLDIPSDLEPYMVLLRGQAVRTSTRAIEGVDAIIASYGPDKDCDYDELAMTVIEYAPTNGIASSGDIVCFKEPR